MATSGKKNVTLDKRFGINNDIKGIYAVEVTAFTKDGKEDFIAEVIRYEHANDTEGTIIGKYSENGTLEIYEGNDTEQQYISKLDYAMTQSAVSITPSYLNAEEKLRYNIRTGNRNIEEVPLSTAEQEASGLTESGAVAEVKEELGDGATVGISTFERLFNNEITTVETGERKARTAYGDYCYPEAMRRSKQDRIKFTMKYSKGRRITTSTTKGVEMFARDEQSIQGSVTLPIQSGIKDQNSVRWNGSSLNALQAFGASAALKLFQDGAGGENPIQDTQEQLRIIGGDAIRALKGAAGAETLTAINVYLAQQAVGTQNLLSRTAGAILNPNIEMLFDAPSLRPFSFQFRMSPRDEDEAAQVRSIINFFKQGMSVKTSSSNVFLKAPNIFDIRYITYNNGSEADHPSINRIKTCALLAASVDYTPDNTYMTYDDPERTMTSYGLTLSFNELDPIYEDDYEKIGLTNSSLTSTDDKIGF